MKKDVIGFIQTLYPDRSPISLHEPRFSDLEKQYVAECIDSTFVSSVGPRVNQFEQMIAKFTGSAHVVATVNGTAALHIALLLAGVETGDEVLTQSLTFVATANAITYCGADPVFIDSAKDNLGMCPEALAEFLKTDGERKGDGTYNRKTGRRIRACVPMHVFGHPVKLDALMKICAEAGIEVVEDAAESLGSWDQGQHTGTRAPIGTLSFNGNKVVTCGGGGAILIRDAKIAERAKHLTTTARVKHAWEFLHDEVGYNYRLPNLNAALGCAQMDRLPAFLADKRETAMAYKDFFKNSEAEFWNENAPGQSNFWLNAILLKDRQARDEFLGSTNAAGIMTRPIWTLMHELPMFRDKPRTSTTNAEHFVNRIVNLPSGVRKV